jgi:hypothetical protein
MANGRANKSPKPIRTLCLPIGEERYRQIMDDAQAFRAWLLECYQVSPELFPQSFAQGFVMKDRRTTRKLDTTLTLRRIQLRDGTAYSIRPSFLMPYMTARTDAVQNTLFLRKFGVPFWALARVFGRNPMFWFRLECQLGRNSIVGTTVRQADIPQHLAADEHHQSCDGVKVYVATTVGGDCCLGAAMASSASSEDLQAAYGVFHAEADNVQPGYTPQTVNTDGWKGTRAAWQLLFPLAVLLRCFLHGWLKIRDRAKNLKEVFVELSKRVWDAYQAPDKRAMAQRLRRLAEWARQHVSGIVLAEVESLCVKRPFWQQAYDWPGGHRTSNMLDRLMRSMHRYFFDGQHLHGGRASNERHVRGWALLCNFTPWHPAVARANGGWRSRAERLNQHRYHDQWLQNLLVSASLGGYRMRAPQNP